MHLYGYRDEERPANSEDMTSIKLSEISLVATPEELRRIAKFLKRCAGSMKAYGKTWEHEHLSDQDKSFEKSPQFIVINPKSL